MCNRCTPDENPDNFCTCHEPQFALEGILCPACNEAWERAQEDAWHDQREAEELYWAEARSMEDAFLYSDS